MKERVKLLPKLSKTVQNVMDLTFYTKAPMWYNNFAENLAIIRKGKDVKELPRLDDKPCICLGAGPSVWRHNHLELLKNWKGTILCCDRMLIECLKRDIVPFAVATVDGDKRIKEFYDDPIVDKYKDKVKAVFSAVTVHPEVVRRCPFEKYWFVPIYDDPRKPKSLTFALYYLSGEKSMLVSLDYEEPVILMNPRGEVVIKKIGEFVDEVDNLDGWKCVTLEPQTFKLRFKPIKAVIKHPCQESLYEVTVDTGRKIRVTGEHSLYVFEKGEIKTKRVDELRKGQYLVVPRRLPKPKEISRLNLVEEFMKLPEYKTDKLFVNNLICDLPKRGMQKNAVLLNELRKKNYEITEETTIYRGSFKIKASLQITEELCELLGWFVSEGSYDYGLVIVLGESEIQIAKRLQTLIKKVFGISSSIHRKKSSIMVKFGGKYLRMIFEEIFKIGRGASNKHLPKFIFNAPTSCQVAFIKAYLKGDGFLHKGEDRRGEFKTSSRNILRELPYLLLLLGMNPCLYEEKGKEFFIENRKTLRKDSYKIMVSDRDCQKIGLRPRKESTNASSWVHRIPIEESRIRELVLNKVPHNEGLQTIFKKKVVSDKIIRRVLKYLTKDERRVKEYLIKLLNRDVGFLKIRMIRKVKPSRGYIYDLSVEGDENFIGGIGGFVCHNTGGTVGTFIFNLAYFLGCNPIILVGYDYSYDAETPPEKTPYWFAYLQLCKWDYEKAKKMFVIGENPYFKTKYMLDLMFKVYREILAFYLKQLPKNVQVINATEGGSLHKPEVKVRCLRLKEVIESFQKNIKEQNKK